MKKLVAFLLLGAALHAQVLLTDDFTSSSLNTVKWKAVAGSGIATVVQSNGGVTLTAQGTLVTTAQFTPPYSITGTVTMLDGLEHLNIHFRSNSIGTTGMFVSFSNDGDQISIQQANTATSISILKVDSFPWVTAKPYSFEIRDTGETITLFVNGVEKLSAQSKFTAGGFVAFNSRDFPQTASRISAVTIATLPTPPAPVIVTVPDTTSHLVNMSTLSSGTFTTGFVIAGTTAKNVLVRAVGPTLRTFGVQNAATQTSLTLNSGSIVLATNSAWGSAPNVAQITAFGGAFPLAAGSTDSAILVTLNPGNYTAQAVGNGAVLLEAYEVP